MPGFDQSLLLVHLLAHKHSFHSLEALVMRVPSKFEDVYSSQPPEFIGVEFSDKSVLPPVPHLITGDSLGGRIEALAVRCREAVGSLFDAARAHADLRGDTLAFSPVLATLEVACMPPSQRDAHSLAGVAPINGAHDSPHVRPFTFVRRWVGCPLAPPHRQGTLGPR